MAHGFRLAFRRGDLIAILLVAVLALGTALAFLPSNGVNQQVLAQVYVNGTLREELALERNCTLEISEDYRNTITIRDGKIAVSESNCPGADCVHSGWIDSPGRSIVCLPNRMEIRIIGTSDVDFVVG